MKFLILSILLAVLAACGGAPPSGSGFADLPSGDVARGAALFAESVSGAPTCASCHTVDDQTLIGPGLQGYGARAAMRVPGQAAGEYTYHSITQPASYVVGGFGNTMYAQFGRQLSAQQIADLIAYLLTL